MNQIKYIGMDVHKATTVIVVLNVAGKAIAEADHRNDLIVNSGLLEKSARNAACHVGGGNSGSLAL